MNNPFHKLIQKLPMHPVAAPQRSRLNRAYIWISMSVLAALGIPIAQMAAQGSGGSTGTSTQAKAAQSPILEFSKPAPQQPAPNNGDSSNADKEPSVSSPDVTNDTTINTQVTVNGQDVPVPDNGSVDQTVTNADGSNVQVTITNSSSSTSHSTRSHLQVHTRSSQDTSTDSTP